MSDLWQIEATLTTADADAIEAALQDTALASTRFEANADGTLWRLSFIFAEQPNAKMLVNNFTETPYTCSKIPSTDWVAHSQRALAPVSAGRFYIHGSHDPGHPLPHIHDLRIDAAQAFGTGRHETTKACLLLFEHIAKRRPSRCKVLDLGCGTGVLALAALRAIPCSAIASDNDPLAVRVASSNAATNRLRQSFQAVRAEGLRHRTIATNAPYDIIFANILARPLVLLAPNIARHVKRNGWVILSGLLGKQEGQVTNAYRRMGLRLQHRLRLGDWTALLMQRYTG